MFDGRADSTDRRSLHTAFIAIGSVLILSTASVYAFYDLNGESFDIADRELRLIVTDSMEGEHMQYDIQTIQKNSLVMVSFLSDGEKEGLKKGDVIQFSYNGMLNHQWSPEVTTLRHTRPSIIPISEESSSGRITSSVRRSSSPRIISSSS